MWFKSSLTILAVAAISFCLIGGTVPAPGYADVGDQLAKLLPDDGAEADRFGYSVAISGDIAIVGAFRDDDNEASSGSAYLFDTATGKQTARLLADDGAENDYFGYSVAISGDTAIVGAVGVDGDNNNFGSAYLFDISDPANPVQLFKLLADDGAENDYFGYSVAISGDTAIVGAVGIDGDNNNFGSAYLFDISDPANPVQLFKLLADDGAVFDRFGSSVAISGTTAIVGTWQDDNENGIDAGSAYLFDTTTGKQTAKLLAADGAENDHFGASVAISGATTIIGALLADDNGQGSASAYLFDTTTGKQIAKLLADDGAAYDFGRSVAISGDTAIVGANADDNNRTMCGSAYLFDISDPANPTQFFKLLANDGRAFDLFGRSVAISGDTAIVGAFRDDDNGQGSGSAYLFDVSDGPPP